MSRAPFRRLARNAVASMLVYPGAALCRWGERAMWPDDRPDPEDQAAITRAAAALESSAEALTRLYREGDVKPRDAKAFNRVAMQFLDLRAVAVGDTTWLAAREADKERRRRLHADVAEKVLIPRETESYRRAGEEFE